MARHDDYLYLRAWNRMLNSGNERWNLDRARREKAPENAIYLGDDGWVTADKDMHPDTKKRLDAMVEQMRGEAWRKDDSYDEQGVKHPNFTDKKPITPRMRDARAKVREHGEPGKRVVPATVGNTTTHMKPIPPVREGPTDKVAELHGDLDIEKRYKPQHEAVDRASKNFMEKQTDESRGAASNRAGEFARKQHERLDREEAREKRTPLIFRRWGWDYLHSSKSRSIGNPELTRQSKIERN